MKNLRKISDKAAYGLVLLILLCPYAWATETPVGKTQKISQVYQKSLTRQHDAVIIRGENLGPVEGLAITALRLYAFRNGMLKPMPFQIDERDPDGVYIMTSGPQAGTDADKGLLDYNDDLVFMAGDAGDRMPEGSPMLPGVDRWVEIELSDPLALEQKAWAYCCHFPDTAPPLSAVDYVSYSPKEERILTQTYAVGYKNGMSLYADLFYADGEGGYGPDLMDRVKMKIEVRFLLNIFKITKTEEDFREEVVGWKDGRVRVLRNVNNFIRILFDLSSPSVFSITEYYADYMVTPLRVTVPFDLKWVFNKFGISNWSLYYYGDLPGLKDGVMYTNKNLNGIPISTTRGKAWYDRNVNHDYLVWGYATKENTGTWFCNLLMPDPLYQFTRLYVNIDEKGDYSPEDIPGEFGGGAYMHSNLIDKKLWNMIQPGSYEFGLETFFAPPGLKPDGVEVWREIRAFPIQTVLKRSQPAISKKDDPERLSIDPEMVKTGTAIKLTDIHGKQFILYDTRFHFGSMLATGMTFFGSQDIDTREWVRVDLNDIRSIDFIVKEVEPVTGIKHFLVAETVKKDGTRLKLMGCRICTMSGLRADGKRVGYGLSELRQVETIN